MSCDAGGGWIWMVPQKASDSNLVFFSSHD